MRQATMIEPGKITYQDVPAPSVGPGEILLRVKRIGVCGTDVHVNHGRHPFTPYPVIQGHEFSAVVEAVGAGVTKVKPGDKATARPQRVCGKCRPCRRGDYHICDSLKVEGFQAPGVARDLFVTVEERIVPLPASFTFEQGALVEPVSVAVHSTLRARDLKGRNVVVVGAGPIGNLVAQLARCRGAKKVLITDLSDFRLDIARKCKIDATSNPKAEPLAKAAKDAFGDEGFDVAFEAVGNEAALGSAIDAINKGGDLVVLGVFGDSPRVNMSVVGDRELSLIGTLMYKHEDYLEAVRLIAEGKVITEPLVTGHFPFEKYKDAYNFIDAQGDKSLKVMIDL